MAEVKGNHTWFQPHYLPLTTQRPAISTMFYTLSLVSFIICIVLGELPSYRLQARCSHGGTYHLFFFVSVIYYKRGVILPILPSPLRSRLSPYMNHYTSIPTSFTAQAASGFSSSNFDLEGNIAGDSRAGLDDAVLAEVRDIMHREHVEYVGLCHHPRSWTDAHLLAP